MKNTLAYYRTKLKNKVRKFKKMKSLTTLNFLSLFFSKLACLTLSALDRKTKKAGSLT